MPWRSVAFKRFSCGNVDRINPRLRGKLGVVRQTVARWVQQYRAKGKSALRQAGRAGRKPRLNEKQRRELEKLLLARPRATRL